MAAVVQCVACRVCRVTGIKIAFLPVCWSLHVGAGIAGAGIANDYCRRTDMSNGNRISIISIISIIECAESACVAIFCIILYYIVLYCIILYYIVSLYHFMYYVWIVFIVWLYLLYLSDLPCVLYLLYGVHAVRELFDSSFGWFASDVNCGVNFCNKIFAKQFGGRSC